MSASTTVSNSLTMLVESSGGMEELNEMLETNPQYNTMVSKQIRKSPSLWKLAGYASIPLGAALGFGLVPSRRLAAHAVGAIVTGIAGAVGKSRLDVYTEANAKPALLQALVNVGNMENAQQAAAAVQQVQDDFGVVQEDFQILCTEVYAAYLVGMVKYNPIAKTSELKEMQAVQQALSLNSLQIGEAHATAAQAFYRQVTLETSEEELQEENNPDRLALDKLLFLTERALAGETPEAFKFEFTRVSKALGISDMLEAQERVAETVEPFYVRALKSTRSKLGTDQVSTRMLERARKTLGIPDTTAADLHVACFNAQVQIELGVSNEGGENVELENENDDGDYDLEAKWRQAKFAPDSMDRVSTLLLSCCCYCWDVD